MLHVCMLFWPDAGETMSQKYLRMLTLTGALARELRRSEVRHQRLPD